MNLSKLKGDPCYSLHKNHICAIHWVQLNCRAKGLRGQNSPNAMLWSEMINSTHVVKQGSCKLKGSTQVTKTTRKRISHFFSFSFALTVSSLTYSIFKVHSSCSCRGRKNCLALLFKVSDSTLQSSQQLKRHGQQFRLELSLPQNWDSYVR